MLRSLSEEQKQHWTDHVPELLWAYNNRVHATTGYSPHMLMFGRPGRDLEELRLPEDGQPPPRDASEWIREHRRRLKTVHKIAGERLARVEHANPRPVQTDPFKPGDPVLVRLKRPRDKLDLRWEAEPYVVKRRVSPNNPVYEVAPWGTEGPTRTLHREMLRPCEFDVGRPQDKVTVTETGGGGAEMYEDWWTEPEGVPVQAPLPPRVPVVVPSVPDRPLPLTRPDVPLLRRSERPNAGIPPQRYADCDWGTSPGTATVSGVECGGVTPPHAVTPEWYPSPPNLYVSPCVPGDCGPWGTVAGEVMPVYAWPSGPPCGSAGEEQPVTFCRGCRCSLYDTESARRTNFRYVADEYPPGTVGEPSAELFVPGLLVAQEVPPRIWSGGHFDSLSSSLDLVENGRADAASDREARHGSRSYTEGSQHRALSSGHPPPKTGEDQETGGPPKSFLAATQGRLYRPKPPVAGTRLGPSVFNGS